MGQRKQQNKLGHQAENYAAKLLSSKGYKIIDRNFRSRFGEIDIIALKEDCIVFIEVKARSSNKFGLPLEAVTQEKIWKISKTAEYYSMLNPSLPKKLCIEVVSLEILNNGTIKTEIIPID